MKAESQRKIVSHLCSVEMPAWKVTSPHLPQIATREFSLCVSITHDQSLTQ